MNDPTYLEAARVLATRTLKQKGTDSERIAFLFRSAISRSPDKREQQILKHLLQQQQKIYHSAPGTAQQLIQVGEMPVEATIPPAELAAWTMLASTILNMDETVTKH